MASVTVVVVDDHPIVRAGLRLILSAAEDISVVAEGASGADALRLVDQYRPQVLVLDVNLPDLNGLEVTRRLRAQNSPTAILILTVLDDRQTMFELLEAGATGYVLKDEALEMVVSAVRAAARGYSWLSPAIARQVVRRVADHGRDPAESPLRSLTARETEVLRLLARGLDNEAIAAQLVVARRTVQNHISTIYDKLAVTTRTEAALLAIRHGLVRVAPPEEGRDGP